MTIQPVIPNTGPIVLRQPDTSQISTTERNFADFFKKSIDEVNQSQTSADEAIEQLHTGKAQSIHDVMISVEQADISLRMLVQVRNKALQAYEEIMRMQI